MKQNINFQRKQKGKWEKNAGQRKKWCGGWEKKKKKETKRERFVEMNEVESLPRDTLR